MLKSEEVTAAELNVIRQFLRDNNIDSVRQTGSALDKIVGALPFPQAGDVDHPN
jgi:hypothetical protein